MVPKRCVLSSLPCGSLAWPWPFFLPLFTQVPGETVRKRPWRFFLHLFTPVPRAPVRTRACRALRRYRRAAETALVDLFSNPFPRQIRTRSVASTFFGQPPKECSWRFAYSILHRPILEGSV